MKTITPQQAWEVLQKADRVHSPEVVEAALGRMAREIQQRLASTNPLLVCIMTGGVVPFGKLLPLLQFPLEIDYVHASRYGGKLQGGELNWRVKPSQDPRGRVVLLVDDILDEGETLAAIEEYYRAAGSKEVYKAVLTVKDRRRSKDVPIDFKGLDVPDRYVFGYGMDYKGYLRNAPGIYAEVE